MKTELTPSPDGQFRRASSRRKAVNNICSLVCKRPIGYFPDSAGDIYRTNLEIIRKLVCKKNTVFRRVWTKHSKLAINYAKGRIYFDNFRGCFNSTAAVPQQMYEMPRCSKLEKIEDALLCECPLGESLPHPSDYTSSLLAVTGQNFLLRISADTGAILEKIYLGSYRKFRYINWDGPQETLVLKSIQTKSATMIHEVSACKLPICLRHDLYPIRSQC
ncbi:DDB1 and CUL4 associated factor 17 L homeolog [Xenopus laevis]|uniref:DDB1 and CUL4 associated factor 17 L homeolog n=1 Tax=Xenopus laevis TaxID=8355 RepID=Q5FWW3_XENLA|nr:DDB1 and CUL4 associated factor 17 L homeolog [Xenopus laevis]AAH89180.1 MGC98859 protein [Xenopus laevis]